MHESLKWIKLTESYIDAKRMQKGEIGFEPMTIRTAIEYSTTELSALILTTINTNYNLTCFNMRNSLN